MKTVLLLLFAAFRCSLCVPCYVTKSTITLLRSNSSYIGNQGARLSMPSLYIMDLALALYHSLGEQQSSLWKV